MKYLKIFYYRVRPEMLDRHLMIQAKAKKLYERHLSSPPTHFRSGGDPYQWIELHWYSSHEECERIAANIARDRELTQLWDQFQMVLDLQQFTPQVHEYFESELPEAFTLPQQPVAPTTHVSESTPQNVTIPIEPVADIPAIDPPVVSNPEPVEIESSPEIEPEGSAPGMPEPEKLTSEESISVESPSDQTEQSPAVDPPAEEFSLDVSKGNENNLDGCIDEISVDDELETEEEINITLDDLEDDDQNSSEIHVAEKLVLDDQPTADPTNGQQVENSDRKAKLETTDSKFQDSDFSFAEKEQKNTKEHDVNPAADESRPVGFQDPFESYDQDEDFQLPPSFTNDTDKKETE